MTNSAGCNDLSLIADNNCNIFPRVSSEDSKSFFKFVESCVEPVAVQASLARYYDFFVAQFELSAGRTLVRRWSATGKTFYQLLSRTDGLGFEISLLVPRWFALRISIQIIATRQLGRGMSWCLYPSLIQAAVIPHNSNTIMAVRTGNVRLLETLISAKEAQISDILSNGYGLIHVSKTLVAEQELI